MPRRLPRLGVASMLALAIAASRAGGQEPQVPEPSSAAVKVAGEIRREALLPPNGPDGRPLPLASHWNVGTVRGTFEPSHQIGLIQAGHHIMPWVAWPSGDPASDRFRNYHEVLLRYFARLRLPFSIRATQWEAMLVRQPYRDGPIERWAGVIAPDGHRVPVLSPFGPKEPWKDPARAYVATDAMRRAQELYPAPPLVLWVSNNEAPKLRWAKHGPLEKLSRRYLDLYGPGRSDEFKRWVVGEGWIERYKVMFKAMRQALINPNWRRVVRFVGYGAFGPSHSGRWDGWKVYSLICQKWTSPNWHFWQGASPSYYTHNWCDNRDHWVWSTQVQSMNWIFMLDEAWRANPGFWWEISIWDGNEVKAWMKGLGAESPEDLVEKSSRPLSPEQRAALDPALVRKSKALQYMADGQTYPPERALGWVQFGLWLLRPRVVREFRGHATPLAPVEPYWLQVVRAVDRVWASPTLREFWRFGRLVPNTAHRHPYEAAIPAAYRDRQRWFLLETNLDPPRPWGLKTNIPVFSLALELGEEGERRWLLYAHSPLADRREVKITVPGFGAVAVDVARAGSFHVVDERTRKVERLGPGLWGRLAPRGSRSGWTDSDTHGQTRTDTGRH